MAQPSEFDVDVPGAVCQSTETRNGIYQESWIADRASGGSRGAILHGLGEHAGRYHQSLSVLFGSGHIQQIRLLDFPGHGHSEGKRGDARDGIMTYVHTAQNFLQQHPELTWVWGHSMGGLVMFNALETLSVAPQIRSIVLTAPSFQVVQAPNFLQRLALPILRTVRASLTLPTAINAAQISSVPDEQKRYRSDPLVHCRISVRLYEGLLACAQNYEDRLVKLLDQRPKLRIFIAHGKNDTIASVKACERLKSRCRTLSSANQQRVRIQVYPNSRHEIHHDQDRMSFFQDLMAWIALSVANDHDVG